MVGNDKFRPHSKRLRTGTQCFAGPLVGRGHRPRRGLPGSGVGHRIRAWSPDSGRGHRLGFRCTGSPGAAASRRSVDGSVSDDFLVLKTGWISVLPQTSSAFSVGLTAPAIKAFQDPRATLRAITGLILDRRFGVRREGHVPRWILARQSGSGCVNGVRAS